MSLTEDSNPYPPADAVTVLLASRTTAVPFGRVTKTIEEWVRLLTAQMDPADRPRLTARFAQEFAAVTYADAEGKEAGE